MFCSILAFLFILKVEKEAKQIFSSFMFTFCFLFYLCIYPPDSQKSDGGANT